MQAKELGLVIGSRVKFSDEGCNWYMAFFSSDNEEIKAKIKTRIKKYRGILHSCEPKKFFLRTETYRYVMQFTLGVERKLYFSKLSQLELADD